jgi:hypothetical protein
VSREPAVIRAAIGALLNLAVVSLPSLGVTLDPIVQGALIAAIWAIVALFIRQAVTPTEDPQLPIGTEVNDGAARVVAAPSADG